MSKDKKNNHPIDKDASFYIECACACGRTLPVEFTSNGDEVNIPLVGNKIWQQLVSENGLEGAIEFLHETVDVG